jgi:SHS2 domain-containing protein
VTEYEATADVRIIVQADSEEEAIERMGAILNGCVFDFDNLEIV